MLVMEIILLHLFAELSAPPVMTYPDWDAVTDNSCPFLLPERGRRNLE